MTTNATTMEERRRELLARQEEGQGELERLQEERRALAPEVADGDRAAEEKAVEIAGRVAAARERLLVYEDALEELGRREEAELAAAEAERVEGLRVEYDALADRRAGLEDRIQEAVEALVPLLDELNEIDLEQRHLSHDLSADRLNEYRVDHMPLLRNWLVTRLGGHARDGHYEPEYLDKALVELNPLERRAPRPAELAEARERNAREVVEREEREREEREDLDRTRDIGERHGQLMGRFLEEDSDVRRQHEDEFVIPTLVREYGEEATRELVVGPARPAEGEDG